MSRSRRSKEDWGWPSTTPKQPQPPQQWRYQVNCIEEAIAIKTSACCGGQHPATSWRPTQPVTFIREEGQGECREVQGKSRNRSGPTLSIRIIIYPSSLVNNSEYSTPSQMPNNKILQVSREWVSVYVCGWAKNAKCPLAKSHHHRTQIDRVACIKGQQTPNWG